ncbi:M20/M25/M40 family metallo-hydrolase [Brevundimonas intermedia]|uniref:Vacuolar membrane protease n=1 Tax=Brevundimonas intermedia TaxID=74315 RepID=A0A4Y9RZH6_9CAUL|nr:M20/M25/M40 family metallo-hydrolase [Brevundimonas intermedia]TFW14647.1 M20/M25/M40 family metallo-hydrolase [Brevundimonas intermedia]
MRLVLFLASLAAALGLAVFASQTPAPLPASTPAVGFSAERAMADVRRIARAPHPVGSAEHQQVQAYLVQRLTDLGLQPSLQSGALSPAAVARIEKDGGDAGALRAVNVVGVLPGRDAGLPAVVLMAHYDSVPNSPGAADDASGVAAILEAVRAIRARGGADRTLIVLLTDAEELNLDGARAFFSEHPLRDRIGTVINLEARGGGGRAMMFETGLGNAETIARYAQATRKAIGGPSSNALAIFIYRLMPNGTDFTVAAGRELAGINLAFIGRPAQYHSPSSTPDALDQGSLQHIGSQALETADAFLRAPTLPQATQNAVYADVFGLSVVRHPPAVGWVLLIVAGLATAFAAWGAHHATGLRAMSVVRGATDGLWLLASAVVVGQAVRVLAGPVGGRIDSADTYYTLLRRLPMLEVGVALAMLALVLVAAGGRERIGRKAIVGVVAAAAVLATALGGFSLLVVGAAVVAVGLSLWPSDEDRTTWGGWLGLIVLVLMLGGLVQVAAPEAAFLFLWPGLIAALAAAIAAVIGARLTSWRALIPTAVATVAVGGWLLVQGHGVFLGVGTDLPGALGLIAVLVVLTARPLAPTSAGEARVIGGLASASLLLGCAVALAARFIS